MSARFAELMALSASKTRETNAATEQLLAEKKRKEEQRIKEQQARDAREREMRAALVRRRLEEAQRAEERQRRQEEERARKEAVLARREEQLRLNLIYGKDKRSALGSSSGGAGSRGRKGKSGDDDGDENEIGSSVLTREEKRMRRLNNDLNRSFTSKRKDVPYSSVNSPRRPGAGRSSGHDVIEAQKGGQTSGSAADDALSRQSLRKQLASMPQQLIKLNTVKRDTRTIDEIMNDLQRAKDQRVIAGDDARGFKDWFASKEKEKEKEKEREKERKETAIPVLANTSKKARSWSRSPSEDPHVVDTGRRAKSAVRSLETGATSSGHSTPSVSKPPERKEPRTKVTIIKPEPRGSIDFQKTSRVYPEAPKPSTNLTSKQQAVRPTTSLADRSNTSRPTKRKRSYSPESLYDSDNLDDDDRYDDYGARGRGRSSSRAARPKNDISSEIWRLFGKDRDRYVQNDVYSDEDDDMEVDADALRREELRRCVLIFFFFPFSCCTLFLISCYLSLLLYSERLAKREDEAALEEERRHEEAKRRKKLMKDRMGK